MQHRKFSFNRYWNRLFYGNKCKDLNEKMPHIKAWAHLKEFPDYYTRLAKMEKGAKAYFKKG